VKHTKKIASIALVFLMIMQILCVAVGESGLGLGLKVEAATVGGKNYIAAATCTLYGHTYAYFDDALSWSEANDVCNELGGHLVTIRFPEEQAKMQELISGTKRSNVWIGATSENTSEFNWVTGESKQYSNFQMLVSSNRFAYVSMLTNNGKWDRTSSGKYGFICEWDGTTNSIQFSSTKINILDANGNKVSDATLVLYLGSPDYMKATKKLELKSDSNGTVTIKHSALLNSGWTNSDIQSAYYIAYKDYTYTDNGRGSSFPNKERYVVRMSSESIDSNGVWSGKRFVNSKYGVFDLRLNTPRVYFNLVVAYDKNLLSLSEVQQEMMGTSKVLAQATDGFAMIDKVECVACDGKTDTEKYNADIRIYKVEPSYATAYDEMFFKTGKKYHIALSSDSAKDYLDNNNKTLTHELGHYLFDFLDEYTNYYKYKEGNYRYGWDALPNLQDITTSRDTLDWLGNVGIDTIECVSEQGQYRYYYRHNGFLYTGNIGSNPYLYSFRLNGMGIGPSSSPFGLMERNAKDSYELSSRFDYEYLANPKNRVIYDNLLTAGNYVLSNYFYLYFGEKHKNSTFSEYYQEYYYPTQTAAYEAAKKIVADDANIELDEAAQLYVVEPSIDHWNEYAKYQFETIIDNDPDFYITNQYYYATEELGLSSGSCWDQLVYFLRDNYCDEAGAPCGDLSGYMPKTAAYRTASYDYAGNVDFQKSSGASAVNNNTRILSLQNGVVASENDIIASVDVSPNANGDAVLTITPFVSGGVYSLSYESLEKETVTDITLNTIDGGYTAVIPMSEDPYGLLTLSVTDGSNVVKNEFLISCSEWKKYENATAGSSFSGSADFYFDESSATRYFTAEMDSEISVDDYISVSDVIVVGADSASDLVGTINLVAPLGGIDYTSPVIFKYVDGSWQKLDTMLGTDTESGCVSATADYFGSGMYCLMAKAPAEDSVLPISNIQVTYPENGGNTVTVSFDESNENIRYYDIFVSENSGFSLADSDVECTRSMASGILNITVGEAGKDYYVSIKSVSENGSESSPSEVFVINTQPSDRDADGIPDEYCDKYGLWGFDGEEKVIAESDEDGDGLTNLEEYNFGSNPVLADTDGDGVEDNMEQAKGLDPDNQMTDGVTYDYVVVYGNPDLYVNAEFVKVSPLSYNAGQEVSVSITVGNEAVTASPSVYVYAKCGDDIVGEWMVSVLGNETVTFDTTFTTNADMENIVVAVDKNREGYDSDYSDNTYTFVPLLASEAGLVQAVLDAIDAIPAVVTADDYAAVESAYNKYSALSEKLKGYVYPSYVEKIESAYATVLALKNQFSDELIDKIADRLFDFSGDAVDVSSYNLPESEYMVTALLDAVRGKYPVEYDVARVSQYGCSSTDGMISSISFSYYDPEVAYSFNEKVEQLAERVSEIRTQMDGMNDYEKVLFVHDYLIRYAEYDDTLVAHSGYDLLINNIGVCESYARAFHMLMAAEGIECLLLNSEDMDHAWNMVRLDGEWYHIDLTWDDPSPDREGMVGYNYFLLSDKEIAADHYGWNIKVSADSELYSAMPRDTSSTQYYYDGKWYVIDSLGTEISSCNVDGTNVERILYSESTISFSVSGFAPYSGGVAVYGNRLFYGSGNIMYCYNLDTGYCYQFAQLSESEKGKSESIYVKYNSFFIDDNGILTYYYLAWDYDGENYIPVYLLGESSFDVSEVIPITSLKMGLSRRELAVGENYKLLATTFPRTNNEPYTIVWSSSDSNVATVDQTGNVSAISNGETVITASVKNNSIIATCKIIVTDAPNNNMVTNECIWEDGTALSYCDISYSNILYAKLRFTAPVFYASSSPKAYIENSTGKIELDLSGFDITGSDYVSGGLNNYISVCYLEPGLDVSTDRVCRFIIPSGTLFSESGEVNPDLVVEFEAHPTMQIEPYGESEGEIDFDESYVLKLLDDKSGYHRIGNDIYRITGSYINEVKVVDGKLTVVAEHALPVSGYTWDFITMLDDNTYIACFKTYVNDTALIYRGDLKGNILASCVVEGYSFNVYEFYGDIYMSCYTGDDVFTLYKTDNQLSYDPQIIESHWLFNKIIKYSFFDLCNGKKLVQMHQNNRPLYLIDQNGIIATTDDVFPYVSYATVFENGNIGVVGTTCNSRKGGSNSYENTLWLYIYDEHLNLMNTHEIGDLVSDDFNSSVSVTETDGAYFVTCYVHLDEYIHDISSSVKFARKIIEFDKGWNLQSSYLSVSSEIFPSTKYNAFGICADGRLVFSNIIGNLFLFGTPNVASDPLPIEENPYLVSESIIVNNDEQTVHVITSDAFTVSELFNGLEVVGDATMSIVDSMGNIIANESYIEFDHRIALISPSGAIKYYRIIIEPIASISLNCSQIKCDVGQIKLLVASTVPHDLSTNVLWSSSDSSIVKVDNGIVTAIGKGKAVVTASIGTSKAECEVIVNNPVTSIEFTSPALSMKLGEILDDIGIVVTPIDTTDNIIWKSSNESIATVVDGKITAISAGEVMITATAGSHSATCTITVSNEHFNYDITPNINGGASKLYEPWGLRYFAVYNGNDADKVKDRGIAILKDKYYTNGMTAEEFVAHENAFVYLDSKGELGFEQPSTNNPNGRYYATLTEGIYSYDISADYYVVPFAVMDNGETIYGTIKSNSMERILRTNLTLPSITDKEKAICSCILSLKDSVAAHYAASGIPGASIDMDVPRGSGQTAAKSTVTPAASGITPNIVAGASRLIEPWGLRYFATYTENSNIADHGVVILCDKYFDASYNTTPDKMRLNANAYVFTESDGTLLYEKISGRYYATVTEGISSKDISDVYYVVPYVVLKDGSYVYGTVKSNSMLKIMNTNLGIASIPETEKAVTRDIIALYEAVKAYYAS